MLTVFLGGALVFGQGNTRSVEGVVSNNSGKPVSGAVVQLKDTKSLQIRSFVTQKNGAYHFFGLSKDVDYELKAEHKQTGASSSTKTLTVFDGRQKAVINLNLDN